MTRILKVLIAVMAMLCGNAFAATYYTSQENCEAAWSAGKAVDYKPTGKHKSFGDARIAGLEKRPLEGDACVLLGAQPGKRWVFLKQGTMVYTKGADVKFLAECQNDMFTVVYLKKEEKKMETPAPPAAAASAPCTDCTKTVEVPVDIVQVPRLWCHPPGGTRTPGACKIDSTVNVDIHVRPKVDSTCIACQQQPARPAPTPPAQQPKADACTGDCVPKERAVLQREERRTDGRCMIQTSTGHRFELRADNPTERLMVALVNPITEVKVPGTRVLKLQEIASKNARGYDCDGMQAQVYSKWDEIRKDFGLPSYCVPERAAQAPTTPAGYTTPRRQL